MRRRPWPRRVALGLGALVLAASCNMPQPPIPTRLGPGGQVHPAAPRDAAIALAGPAAVAPRAS